ncbi:hypothetical protein BD410DRAFT_837425 [Rickenella mellea]|uniref:DUF6533 domain-containing protein n=1 Tax=Rickenella mellea TaxID=50990 RepID=A0A4Y7QCQ2_9AGAM|nr:hypothetical protein BD410DRAFT_837425 [Rickenella mellea]
MSLSALVDGLSDLFVFKCTTGKPPERAHCSETYLRAVAAVTVVIWDYLLTLPGEVELVWVSRWKASTVLFVLNRYMVFIDPIMLLYASIFAGGDSRACEKLFRTAGFLAGFGFITGQCILMLRAYAVWGSHYKKFFAILFCVFFCTFGACLWVISTYLLGVTSIPNPVLGWKGCTFHFANRNAWIDLVLVATVESVFRTFQHIPDTRRPLMSTIYRDGLLYYFFILGSTIANITVMLATPLQRNGTLVIVQRVLHSVLCNRVLLHIREVYNEQKNFLDGGMLLTTVFEFRNVSDDEMYEYTE